MAMRPSEPSDGGVVVARHQDGPAETQQKQHKQQGAVAAPPREDRKTVLSAAKAPFARFFGMLANGFRSIIRPKSIRAKLIRILAFSLVLVFVLLGFLVAGQISAFRAANQTSRT